MILTNNVPILFDITEARTNDIIWAKTVEIEQGVIYVADRGYTDYNWCFDINSKGAFWVTRLKRDAKLEELTELKKNMNYLIQFLLLEKNSNVLLSEIYKDEYDLYNPKKLIAFLFFITKFYE